MFLDLSQPKQAHVEERLRTEPIIWLATVRPDGRPHLVPVWFLWDGEAVLIFSRPNNQKIRNLRANPAVTLALEAANGGEDVAILEGRAQLVSFDDIQAGVPAYVAKYESGMAELGMSWATMSASYSQPIRATPSRLITG